MNTVIFGLGYVGGTAAGCIASQGHSVVGIDINDSKVAAINAGRSPVKEPGLEALIAKARADGLLSAQADIGTALAECDLAIVCVGTPSAADGAHDMSHILQVTRNIAAAINSARTAPLTVAYRSTMRPGSMDQLIQPVFEAALGDDCARLVSLVYNPEFLREASAIADYFDPPKIVIGTRDGAPNAAMENLHEGIDAPVFRVGLREAELTKFVDNSWHAVKVAFANEIGRVCEQLDISAAQVHQIFAADTKLNISAHYTRPGAAFGGSCLPKDVRALQHMASDVGAHTHLVDALLRSNEAHKHHQFLAATQGLEKGAKLLLVGLAFKRETDDLRESPAVDMARKLLDAGFDLDIYDPGVEPSQLVGQNLGYAAALLPTMESLLVDRETAQKRDYARVIATNSLIETLDLQAADILDISRIA
ncbi:nucleotide sugar dehydrogenase [Aurantiacibacter sediminis]|uniref:UDP-glucose 6-dehydrogenase n=1 Tax=Aurantiacibacter sediminis TaxID=2793064 RepID=A0ABS0MZX4_9SPHN|nr:nucleotide sugar dehydrogenase [Aurantiacibacter sediminis]MBH5321260.1 nucleotide sugar dehydrogenase [Aurantiacibacter sediminis]